jgi:tRNA (guanine-N7-)-methyltransferase
LVSRRWWLLANRLAEDGYLHCATDWQHYAEQMLRC